MKIRFKDFRSFHTPESISLKPITLLVGGNSAGKTSFLAGIRYVFDFFSKSSLASFNKVPYFLGSYDDIAHFRGGRFGRAPTFSLEIQDTIPSNLLNQSLRRRRGHRSVAGDSRTQPQVFTSELNFDSFRAQPRLSLFRFTCGPYRFEIDASKKSAISITLPGSGFKTYSIRDTLFDEEMPLDITSIEYSLLEASFVIRQENRESHNEETSVIDEVGFLLALFDSARTLIGRNVHASAPVRSEPQRVYNPSDIGSQAEAEQTAVVLAQLSAFDPDKWKRLKLSLERFGRASGLFEKIDVKHLSKQKSGPFQITINVGKTKNSILDVGYGISQALPLALQMLQQDNQTFFLFQQPEVHLHPKGQAELASFIGSQVATKRHSVVIETHSDYIIDRFRMDARDSVAISPSDVNIVYLRRNELDTDLFEMAIDSDGNIIGAPAGYRDFFIRESARSLDL